MAHHNIPISFRFLKMPVTWEMGTSQKTGTFLRGQQIVQPLDKVKLSKLDGWECRDEFFGLPENDVARLAAFLDKVGVWSSDPERMERYPLHAHVDDVWRFRAELRDALLDQKHFIASVTPKVPNPKTELDLMQPHPANRFLLRFELSEVAAGVVTITNARHMLFATVMADIASGIRFKTCKRKDCGKPFPLESEHKRKFCSQYCGHLVSQRQKRAAKRKE